MDNTLSPDVNPVQYQILWMCNFWPHSQRHVVYYFTLSL